MSDNKDTGYSRRKFLRISLVSGAGLVVGTLTAFGSGDIPLTVHSQDDLLKFNWGFIVDTTRCIGCGACVRACKRENSVPDEYFRTWVERYEIDSDDNVYVDSPNGSLESFKADKVSGKKIVKGFFVPKLCNHCVSSACTQVCPVGATFHSLDGVVLIDKDHCVGCGYCVQACPYGCRYIDHAVGVADKCTLCYHRLHRGLTTACVQACPRQARLIGNLKDKNDILYKTLMKRRYNLLKPEMATDPKCYYIGLDLEVK